MEREYAVNSLYSSWIRIYTSLIITFIGVQAVLGNSLSVIPKPLNMEPLIGTFSLSKETAIVADTNTIRLAAYAKELFTSATGFEFPLERFSNHKSARRARISLLLAQGISDLGEEGYRLSVRKDGITISANTQAGVFYGIQTLRQLLPSEIERSKPAGRIKWEIPCVEIKDQPRFPWRGLMLDCSRTFWSKEYIKRTIRLMPLYKLNRLHLHLTDDQGWRLEITKYPKLTTVGARFDVKYKEPPERQGFYSKADMKDIIEYGKLHNVTIVPEIEMPGHSLALLACYPELSCTGGPFEIHPFFKGPHIHKDILCAGNEKTFKVLEDILSEVIELFPSPFIHIGGDEAPKDRWKQCSKCQTRLIKKGLKNEHELQSYFIKRIETFLNAKGKKMIGWDEILEGGLAPNAAVMSWRGTRGGIAAAKAGHDVVMSPTSHCYFDYDYLKISTVNAYSFEPIPEELNNEQAKHILGAQANFWSHIDRTESRVDKQLFPRLLAIAEITWSPKGQRNESHFLKRVRIHLQRLSELGVKYHHDPSVIKQNSVLPGDEVK
jgi:hexosaminidase